VRRKWPRKWCKCWLLHHNRSHSYGSAATVSRKTNHTHAAATYLPELAPCDFWLFPRLKMRLQDKFCNTQRHQRHCVSRPAHHTKGGMPWLLPSIANTLGNMCVCVCVAHMHAEGMFWGWLEWKALSFEYLSFTAEFQELFDTHLYMYWGKLIQMPWFSFAQIHVECSVFCGAEGRVSLLSTLY
jgi:hypothetical protein